MKTKDRPMRMQWVMLILTIAIAIANVNNSAWQWIVCTLMAFVTGGLFVASWYLTNNQLEEWDIENQKFESECEMTIKDLEAKGYTKVEQNSVAFLNSNGLLILFGSGIEQSSLRFDSYHVETKEFLKMVYVDRYVVIVRKGERVSMLAYVK